MRNMKQRCGLHRLLPIMCSLVVLLVSALATSFAYAYQLPDTGQTKCYQSVDVNPEGEIPCAGTGQDGEYSINPMSFTDNLDGTVTDNNTGLVWQQQDDGVTYNWYRASGTYDAIGNPEGADVCGSLALGGASDWRLPTENELMSIAGYGIAYPGALNPSYFLGAKSWGYWSSNTSTGYPGNAVYFLVGHVVYAPEDFAEYVRCVRGGQSGSLDHFIDNNNGTVTDRNTSLVWQKGEPEPIGTWSSGLSYCEGLVLGGASDWRLPNIKELESLIDVSRCHPAIDTAYFPNAGGLYWSSTTLSEYMNGAWCVDFRNGLGTNVVSWSMKFNTFWIRCVRGGQSGSLNHLPDAVDDAATTAVDTAAEIPVLLNDTDPDGDPLVVESVGTPIYGSTTTNGTTVTYTPAANWSGTDTFSYTVSDGQGGTDTATVTVAVQDTMPPVIEAHDNVTAEATSAAGVVVTYTSPATFDMVDGAGTASCLPASGSTFALGDTTVTCNATDTAGNAATPTTFKVTVKDTIPPVVTAPANVTVVATGLLTTVPYGTATAADAVGVESLTNNAPTAGFLVGTTTITWTAKDAAGNTGTATSTVTVNAWTLAGFYQPVEMNGIWNTVKNGSTVPLKFEVFAGSTELTDVSKVKSVTAVQVLCTTGAEEAIEEVVSTTGGTELRYDTTGGQFIDNWKTPKTAGKCYRVTMTTVDGSSLKALFKLK